MRIGRGEPAEFLLVRLLSSMNMGWVCIVLVLIYSRLSFLTFLCPILKSKVVLCRGFE